MIARELTDAIASGLPDQNPEHITIHFQPFRTEDLAIGGKLVMDRGQPDYRLEFTAPNLTDDQKRRLRNEFIPLLLNLLGLEPHESARIHIRFPDNEPAASRLPALAPAGLLLLAVAWLIARKW